MKCPTAWDYHSKIEKITIIITDNSSKITFELSKSTIDSIPMLARSFSNFSKTGIITIPTNDPIGTAQTILSTIDKRTTGEQYVDLVNACQYKEPNKDLMNSLINNLPKDFDTRLFGKELLDNLREYSAKKYFIACAYDNIVIYDNQFRKVSKYNLDYRAIFGYIFRVTEKYLLDDLKTLIIQTDNTTIWYNLRERKQIGSVRGSTRIINGIVIQNNEIYQTLYRNGNRLMDIDNMNNPGRVAVFQDLVAVVRNSMVTIENTKTGDIKNISLDREKKRYNIKLMSEVRFSNTGKYLIISSCVGCILIDCTKKIVTYNPFEGMGSIFKFSPNDKYLVTLRGWDVTTYDLEKMEKISSFKDVAIHTNLFCFTEEAKIAFVNGDMNKKYPCNMLEMNVVSGEISLFMKNWTICDYIQYITIQDPRFV